MSVGKLKFSRRGEQSWHLTAQAHVAIRIKRIFPRAEQTRAGYITLLHTPEVCRDLEWVLERWQLDMTSKDRAQLKAGADRHRDTERAVVEILSGTRPPLELLEPARAAREYQLVAADLALTTKRLLLADDVGLGKSMAGLLLLRDTEALPALVVCPTHLPAQWLAELHETFPWLKGHIIRSGQPYDFRRVRTLHGHDPDLLIVGYGKLRGWGDHLPGKVRTVIFDEAQELRRADSQKYVAAARIADGATYRVGLTATPVYNYGNEIHNVMSILAPDALGSREEFGREWCHGLWGDKAKVSDPAALGVFLREQGLMLRRTRKDVGRELPDVVRVPHACEADEDVLDQVAGDTVELAELILARSAEPIVLMKASGELDWKLRHATGVAKATYVAEFVRMLLDSERKVVLFGWHHDVYDIWNDRLEDMQPAMYTGQESAAQKLRSVDRFLLDENCRVFICSLRSGAGLDGLQDVARVAVFGELDWSPGMHDQCIGRLHRDGQDESVIAYYLVTDHGSDPVVAQVLNVKRQQADPIRDPDAELFEETAGNQDRIRLLAQDLLARRRSAGQAEATGRLVA